VQRTSWQGLIVACAVWVASSGPAWSQWYVEGNLGTILRQSSERNGSVTNRSTGIAGQVSETENFDPGLTTNLAVGYKFATGMRLATEVGYSRYAIGNLQLRSTDGKFPVLNGAAFGRQWGSVIDDVTATVNAFYDLPVSGGFVPYLGGGIGGVYTTSPDGRFLNFGLPGTFTDNGASTVLRPMMFGEAGLNIAFDAHWAAVPSYRFQHVFTPDGTFPFDAGILRMGVRYSW
jgi:opacity protein-like surface antigen